MLNKSTDVLVIGGGMIVNDQLLPSLYHLQRTGSIGDISICARRNGALRKLLDSRTFASAFPGQSFKPYPDLSHRPDEKVEDSYRQALAELPPRQVVVIAVPDQLHYQILLDSLNANQHVLCVKPLVLTVSQAEEIEELAYSKGLFVGIEYHKRFDPRSLMARMSYRAGDFGEFRIGEAKMIEPYFYRNSNFQNWFTCDQTDPFVYVGCHYVDLVHFITGLKPESVSVNGVKGKFPNGKEGYMWANGRVVWENGAVLNVTGGLGYPDKGAGANDQGLYMICEGDGCSGLIKHNDQHRGVEYSYLTGKGAGGSHFNYVSPDYFRLIPWEGEGLRPTGYGYESVRAIIMSAIEVEESAENRLEHEGVETCRHTIDKINKKGLIATPANSSINEMVIEAARESILNKGKLVKCERVK